MNKNKILTAVMAGTMIVGNILPVYAVVENHDPISNEEVGETGTTRETQVEYIQTSAFTVTIPKKIVLDSTKVSDYTINVKGDISSDKQVKVAPDASFYMKDQGTVGTKKADVEATVTQDITVWSSAEVCKTDGTDKGGNVSALGLTSGSWAGTFEFCITMENAE